MKTLRSLFLLTGLAFCLSISAQVYNEKGSIDLFQQGMRSYQTGQYAIAKSSFQQAISNDPGNGLSYFYMGLCETKLQEYTDAIAQLKKAESIDHTLKDNLDWVMAMAESEAALGNYGTAEGYYRNALKLSPNNAEIYYAMGNNLYLEGTKDTIAANLMFDTCISINPKMGERFSYLADQYVQLGDNKKAIEQYERLLKYTSDPIITYNAARIYYAEEEYDKAIDLFRRTMVLLPNDNDVATKCYTAIGNAYKHAQNYPQAVESFEQILAFSPQNTNVMMNIGSIYDQMHDYDKAKEYFNKAYQLGNIDAGKWLQYYEALEQQESEEGDSIEEETVTEEEITKVP